MMPVDAPESRYLARLPSLADVPDSPSVYSPYSQPEPAIEPDDENASTIRSLSQHDNDDDDDDDDGTDNASHRISLHGPKIRFHSRAPWETDDSAQSNAKLGTITSRLRGKAARADNLIRTFTRGSLNAPRPSADSARSQTSFEFAASNCSSSRGALYDLARQSVSTCSLSSATSARQHGSSRAINYSKPSHYFTQTHTVSFDAPRSVALESPTLSSVSDTDRMAHDRGPNPSSVPFPQERPSHDDFVHPYANPDLVVYHTPSPEPSCLPALPDMSGSDTNSILTDATSIKSAPFSVISTETSTTSLTSRDAPHGNARINGKEISSPISVIHQSDMTYVDRDNKFLSLHPPPAGFDGPRNPRSPTVTLITLQEAQARERVRGTTVHTTVARPKLPFPGSDDILETTADHDEELGAFPSLPRAHVRSTSAGTRYKLDEFAVPVPMGAAPGRPLKHKKSGFMRLFGGRTTDGEKERNPPPIPTLADACVEETLLPKPSKLTRAPKQSFSPTFHISGASNTTLASTSSTSSGGNGPDIKGPSPRRKQPPPLSIVTRTAPAMVEGNISPTSSISTSPPLLSLNVPQSAPPGSSDFPGLKLRPISVSFSSHFADIVSGSMEELQRDVHTPSSAASSSTALSPFTPASARPSDDTSANVPETPAEGHLSVQALQDQLASAKKAWQQQIWDLRGQIRDLTAELEGLRAAGDQEYCEVCGRGESRKRHVSPTNEQSKKVTVVNRPRARTGDAARFTSRN